MEEKNREKDPSFPFGAVSDEDNAAWETGEYPECLRTFSGRLRTGSPAVFVVFEEIEIGLGNPEAAMIVAAP